MHPAVSRLAQKIMFMGNALIGVFTAFALLGAQGVQAQSLIRDAEIEKTLMRIAAPVFSAAGVGPTSIQTLVIHDRSLNAFVVNGQHIFLHSGLITHLNSVEMLQSVLSHELAHITSGHIIRRGQAAQSAKSAMGLGLLLSLAVSAASGSSQAAAGLAAGTASAVQRNFLSHTRAQEAAADQIGVRYLVRAKINPKAAQDVLEIFRGQEVLSVGRQDPYTLTHPLSRERISALKAQVAAYADKKSKSSAELAYWHGRMVAKFRGFIGNPAAALRKVKQSDKSEAALLLRAVAYHRLPDRKKSLANINALLKKRPNDAYYHELKGQILLESGNAKAAVPSYQKAVSLAPKENLILSGYGRALLALGTKAGERKALEVLKKARRKDPRDARLLRDLAVAYAKSGNGGMASLITAERYALLTRFKDAETHANRAAGQLSKGSSGWLRAQDIVGVVRQATGK